MSGHAPRARQRHRQPLGLDARWCPAGVYVHHRSLRPPQPPQLQPLSAGPNLVPHPSCSGIQTGAPATEHLRIQSHYTVPCGTDSPYNRPRGELLSREDFFNSWVASAQQSTPPPLALPLSRSSTPPIRPAVVRSGGGVGRPRSAIPRRSC